MAVETMVASSSAGLIAIGASLAIGLSSIGAGIAEKKKDAEA